VSTRKLILLALACGLEILVAGSIQLLRINHGTSSTLGVGDSTELATVTVKVTSGTVVGQQIRIVVSLSVAASATSPLDRPSTGWSLLTGGLKKPVEPAAVPASEVPSCADVVVPVGGERTCVLGFPVVPTVRDTTYVTFTFAGSAATWRIGV